MLIEYSKIEELQKALKYTFKNIELLEQAFIHPSSDTLPKNYERLEFLGDEVVGLAVSTLLINAFPEAGEGDLSKARSNLIDEQGLATIAKSLDLGSLLILGKGEEKAGGREKDSIISDAFEAMMAVIYLESGWNEAFRVLSTIFTPLIEGSKNMEDLLNHINRDYKTKLQEVAQNLNLPLPEYAIISKEGPEHDITFTVECHAMGFVSKGKGRNKKTAEQNAAKEILKEMRIL